MFFWTKKKESSSKSEGWSNRSKELLLLLAGVVLTLAAIFLARQRIVAAEREVRQKIAPVEIVVPSVPIQAGEAFTEQNLAKKSVPGSGAGSRNVPAAEFELLLGAHAKGNLAPGEPILWTDVEEPFDAEKFSQTIPAGRRAFTMEVNSTSSFAGMIRPGDVVDLLCEGGDGKPSRSWIRGIPVISVDRHFVKAPSKEEERDVSTVTVSVTSEEGRLLAAASREGRIHWFLRNPEEPSKSASVPPARNRPATGKIEVWKAGVQENSFTSTYGEPG
ncbi:MAG: Flp pilus assembly protein CpaB [Deltaproteobacteria bacterium]|nr:Flp pilus assembly protein CpaB [Deltaproteobacteria bacterium]